MRVILLTLLLGGCAVKPVLRFECVEAESGRIGTKFCTTGHVCTDIHQTHHDNVIVCTFDNP